MRSLKDAPVLITGAGRGIGKRLALGFGNAGAPVGLLGRSQGELEVTRIEIEQAGGSARTLRADVTNYEQVHSQVDRMTAAFGSVHTLIANAAVQGPLGPFAEAKPKDWQEVIHTNLLGILNCCRAVLPQMIQRRHGKIIVISDIGAIEPRPAFAVTAATKAAAVRFVESLAEEVREHNLQVNCLVPGEAYTSMTDEILQAAHKVTNEEVERAEQVRVTGGVPAEKQIQFALFLASERSNHLTGKLITVNDDLRRLEHDNMRPDAFTMRRHVK